MTARKPSLKDRLAAKARRRVVVPVQVREPTDEEATAFAEAQAELVTAVFGKGMTEQEQTQKAKAAQAKVDKARFAYMVDVEFSQLDPDLFEALAAKYPAPEGDDHGYDWKRALPVLAAACAVDEDLQDEDWWREQLGSPSDEDDPEQDQRGSTWSHGERLSLWGALLRLNVSWPDPHIPKD